MKKTVVAYGELLWDILPNDTVLGGAPFNFVYRINSLGNTGIMISRLGRDDLGFKAHEQVLDLGIGTDLLNGIIHFRPVRYRLVSTMTLIPIMLLFPKLHMILLNRPII